MIKFLKHTPLILILLIGVQSFSLAQNLKQGEGFQVYKQLRLVAADSLQGFDEASYKVAALNDGFLGDEYHMFMYLSMRDFINTKYSLNPSQPAPGQGAGAKGGGPGGNVINAAPCVNEDFELNNFSGWTVTSGVNSGNCNPTTPNAGSTEAWIRTTPWPDPQFPGNVPNSPLGGTRIAQLNNNAVGNKVTRISQTFPVTAGNALFQFAYCAVFNGAHSCCQRPFLRIDLLNCANQVLSCPQVSVIAPGGPGCGPASPGFTTVGAISKCLWQVKSIDLTPYIGTCITIRVTVGDCSGGAHQGYCFFDSRCMPMNIAVNNNIFPAGTQAVTVAACGLTTGTISAPPGLNPYNWNGPPGSGIVNNANQTFTTQTAGQYTLVMNPVGSCSPTIKYVTLTFAPNPTAGLTYTNACNVFTFTNIGTQTNVTQTFSFTGPAAVPSFTTANNTNVVTFTTPGTYTVLQVVTNTAGCTATAQAVVNGSGAPDVSFSINNPVQCFNGNSFTFSATTPTGTHSYSFSPAAGAPPTGNSPTYGPVSFTQPGTYTVYHTVAAGGCSTFSSSTVVINPQPVPTVTNNGPVCLGAPINFAATGGTAYAWTGPAGFASGVQNPTIAVSNLGNNGSYTVFVTDVNTCTATAVTNVSVFTLITPTIASNVPCENAVLSLTASGGSIFNWSGPNAFTSTLTTPNINNVSLAAAGIYTLISGTGNCTVSSTASITINPLPNVSIGSNTPCVNTPLNLTSGGGVIYAWAGPNAFADNNQNPTIASAQPANGGIYTVTATDANSCTNSNTISVSISPLPVVTANDPTVCVGAPILFNSNGASAYQWTGPNGFTSNLQNPVLALAQTSNTGQYYVIGTSALGCTNIAISNASVIANPNPTITSNSPVCFGTSLTIGGGGGVSYAWTGPNGFTSSNQFNTINNVTLPASGVYTLVVAAGICTAQTTESITVNPLPNPVISMNSPVCLNKPITFTATGGVSYMWTGPNNWGGNLGSFPVISSANASHDGTYSVTVTDNLGCVNSATTSVVVLPLPPFTTIGSTVCPGKTGTITQMEAMRLHITGLVRMALCHHRKILSFQTSHQVNPELIPLW